MAGKEQRTRERWLSGLRAVMSTRDGRRVVWELLRFCRIFCSCFSPDSLSTAYLEGKRDTGLWLYTDLMETAPDLMETARKEAFKEAKEDGSE